MSPVDTDCIPCRGVRPSSKKKGVLVWHQTAYDGETPVPKMLGVRSTILLSLLPDPLWFGLVVPVRVSSMTEVDLFKNSPFRLDLEQKKTKKQQTKNNKQTKKQKRKPSNETTAQKIQACMYNERDKSVNLSTNHEAWFSKNYPV